MDESDWRLKARCVAFFDVFMCSFTVTLGITLVFWGSMALSVFAEHLSAAETAYVAVIWIFFALSAISAMYNLYAAILLLKATKLGADAREAKKKAQIWRNAYLSSLITSIFFNALIHQFVVVGVIFIFRGCCLFVIHKFIQNLRQISSPPESSVL